MKHTITYDNAKVIFPLTHIFCGEIEGAAARGFHSRPNGQDPPADSARKCARPWKNIPNHVTYFGFPASEGSEVFNANTNKWIRRQADTNYYGFFPNQWTVSDVVNKVSKCTYECCQLPGVDCVGNSKTICLAGFTQANSRVSFDVTVFLTTSTQTRIDMVSTFPVKTGDCNNCGRNCRCDVKQLKNKCL